MRIGLLIDDFFPASGGIGRSMQTQMEELTAQGHEVTLIAPDRHLEKPRVGRVIECPTIYRDGLPAHLSVLHPTERRARLINKVAKFDVVHSQTDRGALVLAARLARLQNIPHVHTFHANIAGTHTVLPFASFWGTWAYELLTTRALAMATKRPPRFYSSLPPFSKEVDAHNIFSRMDWRSYGWIAAHVDLVTSPAQYMLDNIERAVGGPIDGIAIPNAYNRPMRDAIAATTRNRRSDTVRFLSIGRLSAEKRLSVLIKAFKKANLPNAELVIVGDGDQRKKLQALAGDFPGIDFRGHLSDRSAIAYELANADTLVLSSYRFDVQPMVIVEAALAGLPTLYCDDRLTTGLTDSSALLTEPDYRSLARGMAKMADPQTRAAYSAATVELVEKMSPATMAASYVAAYNEAIERKAARG